MPAPFPLVEEMLADNILHQALQRVFEGLQDQIASAVPSELASASQQLQARLQRCRGWDFAVRDVRQPDSDDECPAHHHGRSGMLTHVGGPFQTVRLGRQSAPLRHPI